MGVRTDDPFLVLMPAAGLIVCCACHILLSRAMAWRHPYQPLRLGIFSGLAAAIAGSIVILLARHFSGIDVAGFLMLNLLTYLALAFGYLNFVNLNLTSLRIRALSEIYGAGGELDAVILRDRYCTDRMVELRIERLVGGEHLVERNGRFSVGKRQFLAIAAAIDIMRRVVRGRGHTSARA